MTEKPVSIPQNVGARGTNASNRELRVAIFGSCVSRDTCEHLPGAEVVEYVARQSMITALNPVGENRFPLDKLESAFQARMFGGDQRADGVERIIQSRADVVLVDLVDERRGVWQFPDGSLLTNSIEAARAGVEEWAPKEGALLISFGSDEHYTMWKEGLRSVMKQLVALPATLILLDIAWAEAYEGSRLPRGAWSGVGRLLRRAQRGARQMRRAVGRGEPLAVAFQSLVHPRTTPAEQLAIEARSGNASFYRYRNAAREMLQSGPDGEIGAGNNCFIIERSRDDVRTTAHHRWGPAPYHYRKEDYDSIAAEIAQLTMNGEGL